MRSTSCWFVFCLLATACSASKPEPAAKSAPASPFAAAPPKVPAVAMNAYTPGPVTGGGTIHGKVTFTGTPPKLPPLKPARDADVCGKSQPDLTLIVDKDGSGLKNVIVSLTDIHAGKASTAKADAKLGIAKCAYTPRVQAVPVGTSMVVTNVDPIPHDLNGGRGDRVLFNRTVLSSQERVALFSPGMVNLSCDMHGKSEFACETGAVGVMPNPYFAVTGADGSFSLSDVPPGSYTLQAWHETLGQQNQKVTVASSGSATADFHFAATAK
jgi:hypothetical protein